MIKPSDVRDLFKKNDWSSQDLQQGEIAPVELADSLNALLAERMLPNIMTGLALSEDEAKHFLADLFYEKPD